MKFLGNAIIWIALYLVYMATFGSRGNMSAGVILVSVVIAAPLLFVGQLLINSAAGEAQADADLIAKAILDAKGSWDKPYFLYLRPFDSTNAFKVADNPAHNLFSTEIWERDDYDDIERVLSKAISPTAPFAAFGRPGEHRGAGRIFIPDEGWLDQVSLLVRGATVIFAMPASNAGTIRELRLLVEESFLHKTIFIMPPSNSGAFVSAEADWPTRWQAMREECAHFDLHIPAYDRAGQLFMLAPKHGLESQPLPGADPVPWAHTIERLLRIEEPP